MSFEGMILGSTRRSWETKRTAKWAFTTGVCFLYDQSAKRNLQSPDQVSQAPRSDEGTAELKQTPYEVSIDRRALSIHGKCRAQAFILALMFVQDRIQW
jgi:hypothetical protein